MRNGEWKAYAFFIGLSEAVGILAGLLSRSGMQAYEEIMGSVLTPPAFLFPVVWTILYALMGTGAARVWLSPTDPYRTAGLYVFLLQLAVNFFWSLIFFNLQAFGAAFLWLTLLWVLIVLMILTWRQSDSVAAWLQIPYLVWVSFAGYLNYIVWTFN